MNDEKMKKIMGWIASIIIVGGTAEWLAKNVSSVAGYGLVYIVLLAFAVTGNQLDEFIKGLRDLGLNF